MELKPAEGFWCYSVLNSVATETLWSHVLAVAVLLCVTASAKLSTEPADLQDFVLFNTLEDGELETRIKLGNINAKEVTVGRGLGLKFRQLSDGVHFIQLIYDSDNLISDCEYVNDIISVSGFLENFSKDVHQLTRVYNNSVIPLGNGVMPQGMSTWLDYKKLRDQCKKTHQDMKKLLNERSKNAKEETKKDLSDHQNHNPEDSHHHNRSKRAMTDYLIFPGTLWCGASDAASKYQDLGAMSQTDKCCRRHDNCKNNILGFDQKYGLLNTRPYTISECWCDKSVISSTNSTSRTRRDLGEYLRIPGTKWCGKGRSAYKYTDVGLFSATDKCCRRHDSACPFWIAGFETKYGLFNWRVNTIMHCHCDERFRTCLKRVGTSDANLVGKLFFNVVQTKCFIFKMKKTCVQRSWWGKCLRKKRLKQALLRDNIPY